jgi:hypothetical protein
MGIDAIDIDDTGKLLHPILTEKTNIQDMEIGDCILAEYLASGNTGGTFSKIGTATKDLIPTTSSTDPNGSFYFVKVANGLLITGANTGTCQLRLRSETTAVTELLAGVVMIVEKIL